MKFLQFLRKIDLCVLIPYLAYAFFVNCMTVFVEYNYLIFDIPYIAVVLGCVFILGASVFIYKMYHRDFSDKKWMIIYLSWFVFIPIVYNLILLILLDSLYDFSGVFLGGLGSFIYRLLVIAICVIALVIFFVVRFIVSKRHAKGKYADPEKIIIIKNVFNIALLAIVGVISLIAIVSFVDGTIKEKKYNDHVRAVSEFREEMYDKLPAQSSDSALSGEVKMFIFACENADVEELKDYNIEDENGNIFTCTHVTSEVFETGKANYKKFITTHKQDRRFTEGNYNIAFDPDKEQVYAGYDVACEKDGESFGCTFVCTYDKDWNLVDAYCIEGYVDSVLYKKD